MTTRLDIVALRNQVTTMVPRIRMPVTTQPAIGTGREVCEALLHHGVLAKDTHGSTVRLAPTLVVTTGEVDFAVDALAAALADLAH